MRSDLDQIYRDLRPYAFAIAYRMLGSVSETEDVVQEVNSATASPNSSSRPARDAI